MKSTPSLQDQIRKACADQDSQQLTIFLDEWHETIMKEAVKSGSVEILQQVIDRYGTSLTLNQKMLRESTEHDRVEIFKFLLQQSARPEITDEVRLCALNGSPGLWKTIFDERPALMDYDFGEKGDMLGMAVLSNNAPLVAFFLTQGFDPNQGRFFASPIFKVASTSAHIKPEILQLLIQYGATEEKSLAANKDWRGHRDQFCYAT